MVSERGMVVRIGSGEAVVRVARDASCVSCPGCTPAADGGAMLAEAIDTIGVHVGDEVEIGNPRLRPLLDAAILLLLPIVLFVVAYSVGSSFATPWVAVPAALALAALPVAYVVRKERRTDSRLSVQRVIRRAGERPTGTPEAILLRDERAAQRGRSREPAPGGGTDALEPGPE